MIFYFIAGVVTINTVILIGVYWVSNRDRMQNHDEYMKAFYKSIEVKKP
jgi:hypothetical protein